MSLAGLAVGGGMGVWLLQVDLHGQAWGRAVSLTADPAHIPFFEPSPGRQEPAVAGRHPEDLLVQVFDLLDQQDLDGALATSRQLVESHPDFALAQAQLLEMRSSGQAADSPIAAADAATTRNVRELLDEARVRMAAHRMPPPTDLIPSALIEVSQRTRHVLAIDTSEARLYVFENGEHGLRRVDDMYVTVGRRGVGKVEEGDQKTPIGVYHTGVLRSFRPADPRLGSNLFSLNFPNALDRIAARGGTAILMHGAPPDTYSRPPQDSDGCLVFANQDLQRLVSRGLAHDTPVIIARKLDWRDPGAIAAPTAMNEAWRRWLATPRSPASVIEDINMLGWNEQGVVVVSYSAVVGENRTRLRQYWGERDGRWQVLAEGEVR